jgi:uncharacterized protein YfbU (UPF0304 family)
MSPAELGRFQQLALQNVHSILVEKEQENLKRLRHLQGIIEELHQNFHITQVAVRRSFGKKRETPYYDRAPFEFAEAFSRVLEITQKISGELESRYLDAKLKSFRV